MVLPAAKAPESAKRVATVSHTVSTTASVGRSKANGRPSLMAPRDPSEPSKQNSTGPVSDSCCHGCLLVLVARCKVFDASYFLCSRPGLNRRGSPRSIARRPADVLKVTSAQGAVIAGFSRTGPGQGLGATRRSRSAAAGCAPSVRAGLERAVPGPKHAPGPWRRGTTPTWERSPNVSRRAQTTTRSV